MLDWTLTSKDPSSFGRVVVCVQDEDTKASLDAAIDERKLGSIIQAIVNDESSGPLARSDNS